MRELLSPGSFRWNARESYSSIARRLGVDEDTVRKRLRKARLNGLLSGFHLIPNPRLLDTESSVLELDVDGEERKTLAISQLKLLEGVVLIVNFHGKRLRVVLYYENDRALGRKVELMQLICGSPAELQWKESFPPFHMKMRETDWKIFKSLRRDARKSLSEVAAQVRVSSRTVKRRLSLMEERNAFFLMPVTSYEKSIVTMCSFTVHSLDYAKKRMIDDKIRSSVDRIIFSNTSAQQYSVFTVLCNNYSTAEETLGLIRKTDGVRQVSMGIVKEVIPVSDWVDEQIAKRLEYPF